MLQQDIVEDDEKIPQPPADDVVTVMQSVLLDECVIVDSPCPDSYTIEGRDNDNYPSHDTTPVEAVEYDSECQNDMDKHTCEVTECSNSKSYAEEVITRQTNAVTKDVRKQPLSGTPCFNGDYIVKKPIFISYAPDAGFSNKKFIFELVKHLKQSNFGGDVWVDFDECSLDNPSWFISRLKAAESAKVAIQILSDAHCGDNVNKISVIESRLFLHRVKWQSPNDLSVFVVLCNKISSIDSQQLADTFGAHVYDLTHRDLTKKTSSEKARMLAATLTKKLASMPLELNVAPKLQKPVPAPAQSTMSFKRKRMCDWTAGDVVSWMASFDVSKNYLMLFEEQNVNGVLLEATTADDLERLFGVDNRSLRNKILQKRTEVMKKEVELCDSWFLKCQSSKSLPSSSVYVIYDSSDLPIALRVRKDLRSGGFQVSECSHYKTREEFVRASCSAIGRSSTVIVLLTKSVIQSSNVPDEILFSFYFGKKIVLAVFSNVWSNLEPLQKCLLSDVTAVDFEKNLYEDSITKLIYLMKPSSYTGVVLEQGFVQDVREAAQSLSTLTARSQSNWLTTGVEKGRQQSIYISYHLDSRQSVELLQQHLLNAGFLCQLDSAFRRRSDVPSQREVMHSPLGAVHHTARLDDESVVLQGNNLLHSPATDVQQSSVVIVCVTPKYLQMQTCIDELLLAGALRKRIVPVTLSCMKWPPDVVSFKVRRLLAIYRPIDLSNEKTYHRNVQVLINSVRRLDQTIL